MKLITKKIESELKKAPLYSKDGQGESAEIVCKFFYPYGRGTWYVLEGELQENGDWLFFGLVDLWEREYGYFLLSELESNHVERDMYFKPCKVGELD